MERPAWPPRLGTHQDSAHIPSTGSWLLPSSKGGKCPSGEAPCCCCQEFPFKVRARSGYSPFPPVLTTNLLPSSSLCSQEHPSHEGQHQGEEGSLAMVCQHHGGTGPSFECPSVPSFTSTLSSLHSLTSFSNLTHHGAAALGCSSFLLYTSR